MFASHWKRETWNMRKLLECFNKSVYCLWIELPESWAHKPQEFCKFHSRKIEPNIVLIPSALRPEFLSSRPRAFESPVFSSTWYIEQFTHTRSRQWVLIKVEFAHYVEQFYWTLAKVFLNVTFYLSFDF